MKKLNRNLKAFLLDVLMWTYSFLVLYQVIYKKIILDERYSSFEWSQVIYTLILAALFSAILYNVNRCSLGKIIFGIKKINPNELHSKQPYALIGYFNLVITFIAGLVFSQVSVREFLSENGLLGAKRIFTALLSPNFGVLEEALFSAIETIYMAFIATSFALPIAFIASFFAARNLMNQSSFSMVIYNIIRFFLNFSRSIEPLVWAIIFSVWVGIGPFAGMLALCIHSIASLSKLYSEQIENINEGPVEAMITTGASRTQVIWFGVVPQVFLPFLSFTIYRWDINVRMATVIGLVGGGGIGTLLMQYQGLARWHEVGMIVIVIASIVWLMDYISSKVREAIK